MKEKVSTSFILFLISLFISVGVIAATYIYHYYNVSNDKLMFLALAQFIVAMLTPVGIYIAFKSASKKLNKVGLWGNIFLLTYTLGIMVMGAIL